MPRPVLTQPPTLAHSADEVQERFDTLVPWLLNEIPTGGHLDQDLKLVIHGAAMALGWALGNPASKLLDDLIGDLTQRAAAAGYVLVLAPEANTSGEPS